MRAFLMLFVCLALTGCMVGTSKGRSTTSVVRDTGVPGVDRTTVTSEHSGSSFGASMPPMMMMGGGYGYGYGGGNVFMAGPSCALHPDRCAVIERQTVVQPMTVVSYGSSYDGSGDATVEAPDLEARIRRLEAAVPKLAGAGILSLRQSCHAILKDPSVIDDAGERATIVAGCEKELKSNPSADATSEEK